MTAVISLAALVGLVAGSFLNVVAARLPKGMSLVRPRSQCPHCGIAVRPQDNVPVLSWLWLRARCRGCGERISARYPLVEAGTAVALAAVAAVHAGDPAQLVLGAVLVLFLIPMALIDADTRLIPNALTGPAAITAIALGLALDPSGQPERLIAGAAAAAFFFVALLAYPAGMGMGDVKLAGVLGLFLARPWPSRSWSRSSPGPSWGWRSSPASAWPPGARRRCRSGRSSPSAAWSPSCAARR